MNNASLELGGDNWAAKDTKLLASTVSDDSGRFYPREFTFARGSNLSATRVNADGNIEKGRENLLLHSNSFNTPPWGTPDSDVTIGQIGYDGSNNAWLLSKTDTNGRMQQNIVTSGVKTYSLYAKAGTKNWILLRIDGGPNAYFDLQNGVLGSFSNTIEANIESVGNGWYRCSAAFSRNITRVRVYPADGNNDTSGTSGNIYIQDAQLEIGLAATEPIESGATTGKAGILENEPRIDYSDGTASLLLEPQRTNLAFTSEVFGSGVGSVYLNSKVDVTYTHNYGISPEGVRNSTRVQFDNSTAFAYRAVSLSEDNTGSLYVKGTTGEDIRFGFGNTVANAGTIHTFDGTWQRVTHTASTAAQFYLSNYTYTGNQASDFEIYGLQHEEGSYPTSYIPTYGTSVTRGFDYSIVESLVYSSTFTFYYEFNTTTGREGSSPFAEVGKDNSNKIWIKGASANGPQFSIQGNGIFSGTISPTNEVSGINKIAVQWSSGVGVVFSNGVKQSGTLTNSDTSQTIDFISAKGNGTSHDSKQLLFFEEALSDTECIKLTTI